MKQIGIIIIMEKLKEVVANISVCILNLGGICEL